VVFGAGGLINNTYTERGSVGGLAPISQLLAVQQAYPSAEIYAVDAQGGGVGAYLANPGENDAIQLFQGYYTRTGCNALSRLPAGQTFRVNEEQTTYAAFAAARGNDFADVVIAFYPNWAALQSAAESARTLLKPGGQFYAIVDVSTYEDQLTTAFGSAPVQRQSGLWRDIHNNNFLGLPCFTTAKNEPTSTDHSTQMLFIAP
jgi:hypothetical protein